MGMQATRPTRPTTPVLASTLQAAAVPVLVASLAFVLWWLSDRLLSIGPFDRATFGWAVVIPVWAVAPFVAGLRWRDLSRPQVLRATILAALVLVAVIAVPLWASTAAIACDVGPTRTTLGLVPPALLVAGIVAAMFGAACLGATRAIAGGHPWRAAGISGVLQVGVIPVAGTAFVILFDGLCNRP